MVGRLALIAAIAAVGCRRDEPSDKRGTRHDPDVVLARAKRVAPCPNQRCRAVPDGLRGVRLKMSRDEIVRTLGELSADSSCGGLFEARTEIGGEPTVCSVELKDGELVAIECALDASRSPTHHKAIGWGLYQTLARQFGRPVVLIDNLMDSGMLTARWRGEGRTLGLRLLLQDSVSIIRLANRTAQSSCLRERVPQARAELAPVESPPSETVFAKKRMAEKARDYLRDLTGPLEGEP